jgi:hypothetical protein
MDVCINTCQGPALTRISTGRRDLWSSREEAIKSARKSYKQWDERVLQRWFKYGYRTLPTVVYPQSEASSLPLDVASSSSNAVFDVYTWVQDRWPEEGFRPLVNEKGPVTLTTTKHQEVFSYLRPNFKGFAPNVSSTKKTSKPTVEQDAKTSVSTQMTKDIDKLQFADVVGPPGTTMPFYRAEPIIAHMALPHIRPSVLYVFGEKSPLSLPQLRNAKVERTGVGIGGSGGAKNGQVCQTVLPRCGHLAPMEDVNGCAEAASTWLGQMTQKWKTDEAEFLASWTGKSSREKATVTTEWVEKVKSLL